MARRGRRGRIGFWLRVAVMVLYPLTVVLFRHRWRGIERMPATGGVLVVGNHLSYADPIMFARLVWDSGRIPRFLAKDSLFSTFLVGRVVRGAGQIPVRRGSVEAGDSLREAVAALQSGECVCIYPEGTVTRDPDWWPMLGKTGVARLALAADVPVVPVAHWGSQFAVDVYHKKYALLPRKMVTGLVGEPVDLSGYRGRPLTADLLREVTDLIMGRIRDQLGEIRGQPAPTEFWRPAAAAPGADPATRPDSRTEEAS